MAVLLGNMCIVRMNEPYGKASEEKWKTDVVKIAGTEEPQNDGGML